MTARRPHSERLRPNRRRPTRLAFAILLSAMSTVGVTAAGGATDAPKIVSVRDYGARGDGVTNDTAAIQKANDVVAGKGGGTVEFPVGVYIAAGIRQSSNVEFAGIAGATLKHPDGVMSSPIVMGRTWRTTGTVAVGSTSVQLMSTKGAQVGAIVGVRGAGGASKAQSTTLASDATAGATSLALAQPKGWGTAPDSYLLVETEIVSYSGMSGSSVAKVKRGLLGTTAAEHPKGAAVANLQGLVARITSVGASTIEIDRPAAQKVVGANVFIGSMNMTVRALNFDGSKIPGGSPTTNPFPLEYEFARYVRIQNCTIRNGDHAGVAFDRGTSDSILENSSLVDNGVPSAGLGAAVWLYRGAKDNIVRDNQISGDSNIGIAIDDRSEGSSEWDAVPERNLVRHNLIDIPPVTLNAGIFVAGGERNDINFNEVRSATNGIAITLSTQGTFPSDSRGNTVMDNQLSGHYRGLRITGSFNTFGRNQIVSTAHPIVNTGFANQFVE